MEKENEAHSSESKGISHGVKRVLIFSLGYFPNAVGGAEVAIKEITQRIPDIEFHMVTNRYDSTLPKVEKIGSILVHRIGISSKRPSIADLRRWPLHLNKFLYQFLAAWKAIKLHRTYKYDALWAMMAHSCGVPAAIFKMRNMDVPYVLTLQEGDPPAYIERKMWLLWPFFKRAFTSADIVQAISTFLGKWATHRGFKGPLEIIPNAVDIQHFSEEPPLYLVNEIKDGLSKRMGDVFVITTSRLVHKNAVDDVIRALPKLQENVKFIILGVGPDEAKLKKLAKDLNVAKRVQFVGQVSHADLPKYLKACDIFIRPSRSEGMGNSFVEAMAVGLPVVATQEGGIADFLFDERRDPDKPVTGWAVDKDSPEQIVLTIKEIISRPEKVRAVVATARETVKEKYDWDIIAGDMWEKVFARLFEVRSK
ncbi:MAG: glycosyltransferase [Parcubacteria group bacterium Gr01-1014_8]|nr:MAG: glycosyltransferase [Parcubacteria group bacterium Gr01-1014_8]